VKQDFNGQGIGKRSLTTRLLIDAESRPLAALDLTEGGADLVKAAPNAPYSCALG
jgi:hypothetical protein